jgi:hypothetical protein
MHDRLGKAGDFNKLSEDCSQHKHREVVLDKYNHVLHEHVAVNGKHEMGMSTEDGQQTCDRSKENDAETLIRNKHEKEKCCETDYETHKFLSGISSNY